MGTGTSQAEGSDLLWYWWPALPHRMLPVTRKHPSHHSRKVPQGPGRNGWWDVAHGHYWTEQTGQTQSKDDTGPGQNLRAVLLGNTDWVDPISLLMAGPRLLERSRADGGTRQTRMT